MFAKVLSARLERFDGVQENSEPPFPLAVAFKLATFEHPSYFIRVHVQVYRQVFYAYAGSNKRKGLNVVTKNGSAQMVRFNDAIGSRAIIHMDTPSGDHGNALPCRRWLWGHSTAYSGERFARGLDERSPAAPFFLTAPLELASRLTGALAARTRSIIYTGIIPDRMGNEYEIIEYYQWHESKGSSFQPPRSAASTG
jgi:hypothetical protein